MQEILAESGIRIVSGMFSTIGEDYTTPETIRRTGGVVPDEHWDENWEMAQAAAATAKAMGLKHVESGPMVRSSFHADKQAAAVSAE